MLLLLNPSISQGTSNSFRYSWATLDACLEVRTTEYVFWLVTFGSHFKEYYRSDDLVVLKLANKKNLFILTPQ